MVKAGPASERRRPAEASTAPWTSVMAVASYCPRVNTPTPPAAAVVVAMTAVLPIMLLPKPSAAHPASEGDSIAIVAAVSAPQRRVRVDRKLARCWTARASPQGRWHDCGTAVLETLGHSTGSAWEVLLLCATDGPAL